MRENYYFWSTFFKVVFFILFFLIISIVGSYFFQNLESSSVNSPDVSQMWKIYEKIGLNPLTLNTYEREILGNIVFPEDIDEGFENIGGNYSLKDNIERLVVKPTLNPDIYTGRKLLRPPNGIILYGPPGTGKTMTARAIAKEVGGFFINVTSDMIENKFYGESQKLVHALFSVCNKIKPCVIFFDEIDGICGTRNIFDQSHVTSVKTTLLGEMDGIHKRDPGVIVIGATNRIDNLDSALKRRMRLHIKVPVPDLEARESILSKVVEGEPLNEDIILGEIAKKTEGMSGSDLHELCKLAAQHAMKNKDLDSEEILICEKDFDLAISDLLSDVE
tara:strand:- start:342 stop:1340 length:999 start_codon:yes stop_codon:yes gene_type:complete